MRATVSHGREFFATLITLTGISIGEFLELTHFGWSFSQTEAYLSVAIFLVSLGVRLGLYVASDDIVGGATPYIRGVFDATTLHYLLITIPLVSPVLTYTPPTQTTLLTVGAELLSYSVLAAVLFWWVTVSTRVQETIQQLEEDVQS